MSKVKIENLLFGLLVAVMSLLYVGYSTEAMASRWDHISNSGGTLPPDSSVFAAKSYAATGTAAALVFAGPGILYGVHLPSVTAPSHVIFRDTGTANTVTDEDKILTQVYISTYGGNGVGGLNPPGAVAQDRNIQFNPPLRISSGLLVNFVACEDRSPEWCGTVLYDNR